MNKEKFPPNPINRPNLWLKPEIKKKTYTKKYYIVKPTNLVIPKKVIAWNLWKNSNR